MSYRVLARKYRPLDFEGMVGQEHVVQALSNALTQQRLHHAYLFTGTRGVGKTTVSRILAKSLNCTGPDGSGGITARPCGQCSACRDIDDGRFVDYVELDAASNRGVEEISQLLDQAVYKPVLGRFKVYMIDEVHMLSTTAFNAMLKTLEEPPDYLKFVLATTDPQKVPPTVLSRCLQFNLRPMPPQVVQDHLSELLAREQIAAEPAALRLLSRAAQGSMRDALSLADQAIAFGAGSLDEVGVREMLGAVDSSHAVRILQALEQVRGADLVAAADTLRALGLSASGALEELAALLQQLAVTQVVPQATTDSDVDAATLQGLASAFAADELQLLYSIALHGRAELGLAPDEYSGLVMVLLRMLAFRPQGPEVAAGAQAPAVAAPPARAAMPAASAASPRREAARAEAKVISPRPAQPRFANGATSAAAPDLASSVAASAPAPNAASSDKEPPPWVDAPWPEEEAEADGTPSDGSAAAPPRRPEAASGRAATDARDKRAARDSNDRRDTRATRDVRHSTPTLVPDALGDRWEHEVREMIAAGRITALVRELALQCQCVAVDESAAPPVWRLRVERENLRATSQVDKLQAALAAQLGRPIMLDIVAGAASDSITLRDAAERARRQAEAEQIIHDDPLVQTLLAQFKTARIVPGSVKPH